MKILTTKQVGTCIPQYKYNVSCTEKNNGSNFGKHRNKFQGYNGESTLLKYNVSNNLKDYVRNKDLKQEITCMY